MPMIDVYAAAGSFPEPHRLARGMAAAVMRWKQVPHLPLAANNLAALIDEWTPDLQRRAREWLPAGPGAA
jgi:hypothetical protein